MENFDYFILARTIHVVCVVLWIGGLAFVTTVLIPALIKFEDDNLRIELFEKLENRFAFQAKIITLITGVSGLYLIYALDAWSRYQHLSYWWMHLMTLIWFVFSVVLFILEPLFLHRVFKQKTDKHGVVAFIWMHRLHVVLLSLSLTAVLGAVAGSHGYQF
ncbi:MAG: hypothetical protein JKY14_04070 [Paraglaciecola sp.]|nr:hypothetical protein [Paraglaciecola sp.]